MYTISLKFLLVIKKFKQIVHTFRHVHKKKIRGGEVYYEIELIFFNKTVFYTQTF